jgi:phosphoglycolate phosphatase-like HAD superfamily hydrolase
MSDYTSIRGIVFDLDDTIIDSAAVHAAAWRAAADKYGVELTPEFLEFQRGRTNEDAAQRFLDPLGRLAILREFVREKSDYAEQHACESQYLEDFGVAYEWLRQKGIKVWICTSSSKRFCLKVYETFGQLRSFAERTVWREMYESGKSQGLRVAFDKMIVDPKDGIYVGDAPSDWVAAQEAGCLFVRYGGLAIERHSELLSLLS